MKSLPESVSPPKSGRMSPLAALPPSPNLGRSMSLQSQGKDRGSPDFERRGLSYPFGLIGSDSGSRTPGEGERRGHVPSHLGLQRSPAFVVVEDITPKLLIGQRASQIFDIFADYRSKLVDRKEFLQAVSRTGLCIDQDPRLASMRQLASDGDQQQLNLEQLKRYIVPCLDVLFRALSGLFEIPDFEIFGETCQSALQACTKVPVPEMVALCTVDGQQWAHGDVDSSKVCLQELAHCVNYLIARDHLGAKVHDYIGREYSGSPGNAFVLTDDKRPHNPLVDVGGMQSTSLIQPTLKNTERYQFIFSKVRRMAASLPVHFSNDMYSLLKDNVYRSQSMAFFMKEFIPDFNAKETLNLYFQIYSIEMSLRTLSVFAATIANFGVCPMTGEKIFDEESVRDLLANMYVAGVDVLSGEFAFKVGFPAKSALSGVVMLIIPGVLGLCTLEEVPKNAKLSDIHALEFYQILCYRCPFGTKAALPAHSFSRNCPVVTELRYDPLRLQVTVRAQIFARLVHLIVNSEVDITDHLLEYGTLPLHLKDFLGRTLLHHAAMKGHLKNMTILIQYGAKKDALDVFGRTPQAYLTPFNYDAAKLFASSLSYV